MGGSFELKELVYQHEIVAFPCKPKQPGDCIVEYEGNQIYTVESEEIMSRFFQDYVLSVSYIEFDSDVKNLEKPLIKNVMSRDYRFHSKNEFWAKLILS